MKKIFSVLLCMALLLGSSLNIFAASAINVDNEKTHRTIEAELDEEGRIIQILEYADGSADFKMLDNNKVISESFVDPTHMFVRSIDYQDGVPIYETTTIDRVSDPLNGVINEGLSAAPLAATATNMGNILYEYYIQGTAFTRTLAVSYQKTTYANQSYDLNGTYKGLAKFAAVIYALYSVPAEISLQMAKAILDKLGIPYTAADILIPSRIVKARETKMTWYATSGSTTGFFSGSMYTVTEPGYSADTYYGDNYYPTSAYTSHNISLAEALKNCINVYWGDGQFTVLSWN